MPMRITFTHLTRHNGKTENDIKLPDKTKTNG